MGLLYKIANSYELINPENKLFTNIKEYSDINKQFQCIVLASIEDGQDFLLSKTSAMLASLGTAYLLPGGNCLVLIPGNIDRELLGHRLSHSIKTPVLHHFFSVSFSVALRELNLYL